MDSSVSRKDEIWFLRVRHHVPHELYARDNLCLEHMLRDGWHWSDGEWGLYKTGHNLGSREGLHLFPSTLKLSSHIRTLQISEWLEREAENHPL